MALDVLALMTEVEFRRALRSDDISEDRRDEFIDAINEASAMIRRWVGRRLLWLGTDYVEFHDVNNDEHTLWLRERPVISITTIEEDSNRNYGAASELTLDDEYLFDKNRGTISRVSGTSTWRWERGARAVKVTYAGGYDDQAADKANVPGDLKRACSKVGANILRESDRKMQGVSSISDTTGSVSRAGGTTRFIASALDGEVKAILAPYRVRGYQTYITDEVVA